MTIFIQEIKASLDELPTRKLTRKSKNRRGVQRLAFACVYSVAMKYGVFADPEYEIRYRELDGSERRGWLDIGIQEPNHYLGLLLACEIVTDKVLAKDLLKLRDAPVSERGRRLVIQLNPFEKYPIDASLALLDSLTDKQAESILIMRYRGKLRTLLDRRKAAQWAAEKKRQAGDVARYVFE